MAWRCRFMSASEVPKSTQKLVQPVVVAGLRRVSARHPAGSLRSTNTNNDDNFTRGAATDLMGEVGDALAAPRVASVAGEKSMWWSPEKGVRTKKSRSVRSGVRNRKYQSVISHYGSAPDHTRPEGVGFVGSHTLE